MILDPERRADFGDREGLTECDQPVVAVAGVDLVERIAIDVEADDVDDVVAGVVVVRRKHFFVDLSIGRIDPQQIFESARDRQVLEQVAPERGVLFRRGASVVTAHRPPIEIAVHFV